VDSKINLQSTSSIPRTIGLNTFRTIPRNASSRAITPATPGE